MITLLVYATVLLAFLIMEGVKFYKAWDIQFQDKIKKEVDEEFILMFIELFGKERMIQILKSDNKTFHMTEAENKLLLDTMHERWGIKNNK